MDDWQARLRLAITRSGKKHSEVARAAKIAPETLSRLLNDPKASPHVLTLLRVARAVEESVGWLLGEQGYELSWFELRRLREIGTMLDELTRSVKK